MGAEIDDRRQDVDCAEAKEALGRLLADKRFKTAERQKAILSYLVERRFDHEDVKAYVIAVDVLGRPSSFDSAIDPIVRIEISRLRSSLESFYAAFGDDHDIWINIKKGKYLACFTRRADRFAESEDVQNEADSSTNTRTATQDAAPGKLRWKMVALYAIASALLLAICIHSYASAITISQKPTVYVSAEAANPLNAGEASQMRDGLLTALTQFQTLTVAQPAYKSARTRKGDRQYSIQLKYYGDADDRSVLWQVIETASGQLLTSGLEKVETSGKSPATVRDEIVAVLAKRIGSSRGVINSIELKTDPGSLGNGCVIQAEYALDVHGDLDTAVDCLQRTVQRLPGDADAKAVLARVLLAPAGRTTAPDIANHALDLAQDAVARAPLSDRAHIALMAAQAAKGRLEAAIEAGNRAITLNPNNPDASAALGALLYSAGYRSAGLSMAKDASKDTDAVPRCAMIVLALDAFRDARYSEALLWTEQVNGSSPLTKVIRAATLGELDSAQASNSLSDGDVNSTFFKKTVDAAGLQPEVVSMLERGLTKAGADFGPVRSISR
ncbi:tetratricopeptide repeat protein (plasmid) [Rhizobium grahamii]|uniref:Tetratricopeptide repeat protein n=1 Tax=Rhizobium grahamii TaxID=1120045 RepID=A0A5Q0CDM0_9HYPH|nr:MULTISPECIES: tetratricopeptide repeat protein [Rhizobium]QFY63415.1 tetratricopeptide repeat protein [Rhizobium grahamii]QRM51820.1 tetratricopeptide repeat protein [Rhizobium sp. BG6]